MKPPAGKRNSSVKSEKGFTILEIVIAMVIMMIVGLAAVGGFVFAIRYNSTASDRAASVAIAQSALEKLRALPFTDSSLAAGTTTTPVSDGAGRTYTLTTKITDIAPSGKTTLKQIEVKVTPVNVNALNTTANGYYGSVMLFTERCNPLVGTNIH
jgi:Tfp pilus assembly protein PilV